MAQDRWWIHQRGKSLYSTRTLLTKMCMAKTCNKCQYMMIYSNICQYMSIYGSRLDLKSISFYSVKVHHLLESLYWNNLHWHPAQTVRFGVKADGYMGDLEGVRIRKPRFQLVQGPMPIPPQWLQPSHHISSANESASDLPRFAPICPDLPVAIPCYTIICITRSLTQQLTQQYQTVTKSIPVISPRPGLWKSNTQFQADREAARRQPLAKKVRINEHQNIWIHLTGFDRVDASNRKTSSGTNIQNNSR